MADESPTLHSYGDGALKDAIEKNAQGPRSARGDVGEVEQHSLTEQIEPDPQALNDLRAMVGLPPREGLGEPQHPGSAPAR